jgi:hypothetical protein
VFLICPSRGNPFDGSKAVTPNLKAKPHPALADQRKLADVRLGSKTVVELADADFRFPPESGPHADRPACPLRARSGSSIAFADPRQRESKARHEGRLHGLAAQEALTSIPVLNRIG